MLEIGAAVAGRIEVKPSNALRAVAEMAESNLFTSAPFSRITLLTTQRASDIRPDALLLKLPRQLISLKKCIWVALNARIGNYVYRGEQGEAEQSVSPPLKRSYA
jgi:hypothetical protein